MPGFISRPTCSPISPWKGPSFSAPPSRTIRTLAAAGSVLISLVLYNRVAHHSVMCVCDCMYDCVCVCVCLLEGGQCWEWQAVRRTRSLPTSVTAPPISPCTTLMIDGCIAWARAPSARTVNMLHPPSLSFYILIETQH